MFSSREYAKVARKWMKNVVKKSSQKCGEKSREKCRKKTRDKSLKKLAKKVAKIKDVSEIRKNQNDVDSSLNHRIRIYNISLKTDLRTFRLP